MPDAAGNIKGIRVPELPWLREEYGSRYNPGGIDYDSVKIPDKVRWCGRPNCRCVQRGKAKETPPTPLPAATPNLKAWHEAQKAVASRRWGGRD